MTVIPTLLRRATLPARATPTLLRWLAGCITGWLLAPALFLATTLAWADAPSAKDAQAVRQVINAQLAALAAGDGPGAFAFAAPSIQQEMGDATNFLAMVQQGYGVLIRPRSVAFFQPEWHHGELMQVVQVQGSDGSRWLASYVLQRQPGGAWRIAGCVLRPDEGKLST